MIPASASLRHATFSEDDPPTLPVHHHLPESHVWDAKAEEWLRDKEERCPAYQQTGSHQWEQDASPSFFCRNVWIGYMEHCTSIVRTVDRFGQRDEPCGASRFPDSCHRCGRDGEYLCDAPACDVPMCEEHRHPGFRGMDFCAAHEGMGR